MLRVPSCGDRLPSPTISSGSAQPQEPAAAAGIAGRAKPERKSSDCCDMQITAVFLIEEPASERETAFLLARPLPRYRTLVLTDPFVHFALHILRPCVLRRHVGAGFSWRYFTEPSRSPRDERENRVIFLSPSSCVSRQSARDSRLQAS